MSQENSSTNPDEQDVSSASDKVVSDNTKDNINKTKKGAGNLAKKALKNPHVKAFIVAHFIPIVIVVGVILVILMLIGDVAFLLTMPGMVLEKVKETALGFWANFSGWFTGDSTTAGITQEDILGLAQYLQNMGYDIESYGLGIPEYEEKTEDDKRVGISKTLKKIESTLDDKDYLKSYIAANENTYALAELSIYGTLTQIGTTVWNFLTFGEGEIETARDVSTGMINIINTNSAIHDLFTLSKATPEDYVKIDRDSKKMIIYTNTIHSMILDLLNISDGKIQWGSSFSFDLSNWTAKYGRPVELMLAIHLSTMMPDLSYRIATDKDVNTKVNIVLQDVNMKYDTKIKSINGSDRNIDKAEIIDYFLKYALTGEEHEYDNSESEEDEDTEEVEDTESDEDTESTGKQKLNVYETVYNSLKDDSEKEEFFISIMNEYNLSNTLGFADRWGINILNSLQAEEFGIGRLLRALVSKSPVLNAISRLFLDEYYVYIKRGSELVPDLGITYDALFELASITAKGLNGVENIKWPYIESITNHWFYKDIDFSTGVYRKAASAKKKINYESASEESTLNKEGIVVELDATLTADEGIVYQVCEPEAEGPNQTILDIFNDSYYRYDGTTQTAEAINNAKGYDYMGRTGPYKGYYIETPTVEKEKVSFEGNKANALAAFSILENMHSEEADFVYRNLKDLVVTLNYFSKSELTTELENMLLWMIETDNKNEEWQVTKDGDKYGMTIKNVGGRKVIAPENAVVTVEGDTVSLKFTQMSDETKELLEYIYADYYKTINKDALVGITMKIKGLDVSKTGNVNRGDEIGTAEEELNIKMIDVDKSLIEDVEIYMSQKHNHEYERLMKEKKENNNGEGIDIGRASKTTLKK